MTREKLKIPPTGNPDYPLMMLATVLALKDLGGSGTNDEIAERIIKNEEITEEEQTYLMRDGIRTRIDFNLPWARTCLKGVGYLENIKKSVWALTESGFNINTLEDATKASDEYNAMIVARQKKRVSEKQENTALLNTAIDTQENFPTNNTSPDEITSHDDDWKSTLLYTLKNMEGYAFERLCQRLLREAGFIEVNVNPKKGADGGIDGIGVLRVNLVSFKVYFQCKCWTENPVGAKDIRNFRGALDAGVDKGLFITTSTFTSRAKDEATMKGKTVIDLIDGERLCDLLKENNLGVQTEMVEHVTITPEWFDRFNTKITPNNKETQK